MKYKIFCETENKEIEVESLLYLEACPNSSEHVVRSGSLYVVDTEFNECSQKDYRLLRHELIEYVAQNYVSMTADALKQAASHFCAPQAVIDQFFTPLEQISLGKEFHINATKCRKDRFNGAVTVLFNHLTYEETGQVIQSLNSYIWKYVDLGVEGTTESDPVGVFDYFTSTSGTLFENNGFMETGFTPRHGVTLEQLQTFIMTILQSGCLIGGQYYLSITQS